MTIWAVLSSLWSRFWAWLSRRPAASTTYRVERVDNDPEHAKPGVLYVVEDVGRPWAAVMACPGGCGQLLHMNLIPDTKPVWRLTTGSEGAPTLHPSIWRREGCGCHFYLRQGRVEWCGDQVQQRR